MLIALGFALTLFVVVLAALARVDSVIREIYASDRQRWRELGSPMGFFWIPREKTSFFRSVGARNDIVIDALFCPGDLKRRNAETPPNNPPEATPGTRPPAAPSPSSGAPHL